MENVENQLAAVGLIGSGFETASEYILFVTDKRMVFICTKTTKQYGQVLGALAGGVPGAIIGASIQKSVRSGKNGSTEQTVTGELDELLKNDEKNMQFAFADLDRVKLLKAFRGYYLIIHPSKGGKKGYTSRSKEDFEKLSATFQSIPVLKGKL